MSLNFNKVGKPDAIIKGGKYDKKLIYINPDLNDHDATDFKHLKIANLAAHQPAFQPTNLPRRRETVPASSPVGRHLLSHLFGLLIILQSSHPANHHRNHLLGHIALRRRSHQSSLPIDPPERPPVSHPGIPRYRHPFGHRVNHPYNQPDNRKNRLLAFQPISRRKSLDLVPPNNR